MYSERIQILVSPEQRRRWKSEARRQQTSIAGLVRESVDARFGSVTRDARLQAVAEIRKMSGQFVSPEDINRIVGEEREQNIATTSPAKQR